MLKVLSPCELVNLATLLALQIAGSSTYEEINTMRLFLNQVASTLATFSAQELYIKNENLRNN